MQITHEQNEKFKLRHYRLILTPLYNKSSNKYDDEIRCEHRPSYLDLAWCRRGGNLFWGARALERANELFRPKVELASVIFDL